MQRLGIYVVYDPEGIVDNYITYFLDDLIKHFAEFIIVCNGMLSEKGRKKLEKYTSYIIVRENQGYDTWAYKAALDFWGWERLRQYDEVVLLNDTIMGPVYPFEEMFFKMDKKNLDFWGITRHYEMKANFYHCVYGYTPEHIQSYFMAIRKSLLISDAFKRYWEEIPEIHSYEEAVGNHEVVFTKYFSDMGFQWDTYVDTSVYEKRHRNPSITCAKEIVERNRCPVFKKRLFFQDYDWYITISAGQFGADLLDYLDVNRLYPTDYILENVLRTRDFSDVYRCFHWNYVLPKNDLKSVNKMGYLKIAFIFYCHIIDLLEDMLSFIKNIPQGIEIIPIVDSKITKAQLSILLSGMDIDTQDIRIMEPSAGDKSCVLQEMKQIIEHYDLIGFVHDIDRQDLTPDTIGGSFLYKELRNMLDSKEYILNILDTFVENPRLGLLAPPEPNHGTFIKNDVAHDWEKNREKVISILRNLGVKVPINKDNPPVSFLGNCFWARTEALKALYRKAWTNEEIEKMEKEKLFFLESVYSYIVQDAGYYAGYVMSDAFSKIEFTNMAYQMNAANRRVVATKETYETSTCWRITAPVRFIGRLLTGK